MNKSKVKASSTQLSVLRTEMILHPDMGQANPHVDERWQNLKTRLDGYGVIRILEQWKNVNI